MREYEKVTDNLLSKVFIHKKGQKKGCLLADVCAALRNTRLAIIRITSVARHWRADANVIFTMTSGALIGIPASSTNVKVAPIQITWSRVVQHTTAAIILIIINHGRLRIVGSLIEHVLSQASFVIFASIVCRRRTGAASRYIVLGAATGLTDTIVAFETQAVGHPSLVCQNDAVFTIVVGCM